jgi:hypothetical protein
MRPTISEMPWNRASHLAQIGTVRQCSMPLMLAPGARAAPDRETDLSG